MSTLHEGQNTDPGMLPQSQALEPVPADKDGVSTKRGTGAHADAGAPVVQHGRGETHTTVTSECGRHPQPSSDGSGADREVPAVAAVKATHGKVPVLGKHGQPLMPCHPARARKLLKAGRAVVANYAPFVIRLRDRTADESDVDGVQVGVDPGSRHTGVAVFTQDDSGVRHGLLSIQVNHRGNRIRTAMHKRAMLRRGRRSRKTRYRAPRFNNRTRPDGWLAPSLQHRVDGVVSMVARLTQQWLPVTDIHVEQVRFDMQKLDDPEISGVSYQQGELAGFEVREYLLAKFDHTCVYCGAVGYDDGVPLNIDHVVPRARGGSNRVSNLVLACVGCNQAKGVMPVSEFVDDDHRLATIKAQAKAPLADAAAVNSTRNAVVRELENLGVPVATSTGGRTKFNRSQSGLGKSHTAGAVAVGECSRVESVPSTMVVADQTGRGGYCRTRSDKYGFPRLHLTRTKCHFGFQTGDLVKAVVPSGKKAGVHEGRVSVRKSGSFNIATTNGTVQGIHHRHCRMVQRGNGWNWSRQPEQATTNAS